MGLFSALRRRDRAAAPQPVSRTIEVVVEDRVDVSDRSVLLTLRATAPELVSPVAPGAHIDLHLGGTLVRQYSVVEAVDADAVLSVCVQHEVDGRGGSAKVHTSLRVGDRLHISAPRNTFPLRTDASKSILLAGGVGVTPLVSMASTLHRAGRDFELHAYAATATALPLHQHLVGSEYAAHVFTHFSATGDSFRAGSPASLLQPVTDGAVYLCGPSGFVDEARRRALGAGWREEQIVSERFTPAPPSLVGAALPFTVIASSTGQEMQVEASESIAEVLERNGYETYRSCGQGFCGSCVTPVLAGVPDHRDDSQSEAEHAANSHINVCCSRSLTPRLELEI